MTDQEKIIFAQILGKMAWADGELHPQEQENALNQMKHLDLSPSIDPLGFVQSPPDVDVIALISKLGPDLLDELIRRLYLVAKAHWGMAMTEEALLRKISAHAYPGIAWNIIRSWLDSFDKLERQTKEITGRSHYL